MSLQQLSKGGSNGISGNVGVVWSIGTTTFTGLTPGTVMGISRTRAALGKVDLIDPVTGKLAARIAWGDVMGLTLELTPSAATIAAARLVNVLPVPYSFVTITDANCPDLNAKQFQVISSSGNERAEVLATVSIVLERNDDEDMATVKVS